MPNGMKTKICREEAVQGSPVPGKVKAAAAGKRHGMIKRSNKFHSATRAGMMVLAEPDGKKVRKELSAQTAADLEH